jgi:hypothetical protein
MIACPLHPPKGNLVAIRLAPELGCCWQNREAFASDPDSSLLAVALDDGRIALLGTRTRPAEISLRILA